MTPFEVARAKKQWDIVHMIDNECDKIMNQTRLYSINDQKESGNVNMLLHAAAGLSETLEQNVVDIVSEVLSVSDRPVTQESHFQNDLGVDSLDAVELVMALEEKFEIDIPDDAAEGITTVGEAVAYIREQRSSASGES